MTLCPPEAPKEVNSTCGISRILAKQPEEKSSASEAAVVKRLGRTCDPGRRFSASGQLS